MAGELFSQVLFATDFTETSRRAQQLALAIAQQCSAAVHVLHVVELIGSTAEDPELRDFYGVLTRRATAHLEDVATDFRAAGVEAEWEVALGVRWQVILERARDIAADLIVLGSHGLQPDREFVPGSTSQRVPLLAPCPVLLVPGESIAA